MAERRMRQLEPLCFGRIQRRSTHLFRQAFGPSREQDHNNQGDEAVQKYHDPQPQLQNAVQVRRVP